MSLVEYIPRYLILFDVIVNETPPDPQFLSLCVHYWYFNLESFYLALVKESVTCAVFPYGV